LRAAIPSAANNEDHFGTFKGASMSKTNGHFPWEKGGKMSVASYTRDLEATRNLPFDEKFSGLLRLCEEAKHGTFRAIVAVRPEILGEDYAKLVSNLLRCAQAGLMIAFAEQQQA
jgi:hypothetical protein